MTENYKHVGCPAPQQHPPQSLLACPAFFSVQVFVVCNELNQLGADSLTSLRRLAEALPKQSVDGKAPLATGEDDDDEVPDLVENFDEASKNEAN